MSTIRQGMILEVSTQLDGDEKIKSLVKLQQQLADMGDSELSGQRELLAVAKQREAVLHELSANGDADIRDARIILGVERERMGVESKILASHDKALNIQRQEVALQQKSQNLATELAAQADSVQATERKRLALMRQIEAAQVALASASDDEQEAARQKIADLRKEQALSDAIRQQLDSQQESERMALSLMQNQEQSAQTLQALYDQHARAAQKQVALERQRLSLDVEAAALSDGSIVSAREQVALQQKRLSAAIDLAALSDADLADANRVIALERERAAMATKIEATKDDALTAQRQELAITQKIEALTTELSLLENDAVQDAQRVLAVNREIEATKAKLAAAQDAGNEAARAELAAIQDKQKLEDNLAATKARMSDAALNAAQYEEQFLKEKLQLENKLKNLNATDPEYEQTKKNIKLIEDRRSVEAKIASLGDTQTQALALQLDIEQQKLATAKQIADIEAGGSTDKDLAALKEKLGLLEQQQQIEDAIAESKRKAPGGDLADLQALNVVQQTTQDTQDELTKLQAIANDPAMLKQIKQQRALQQQIDASTRTWRDYINTYAELLEKMDSSIQAWATFGMAISAAWSVYTSGALSRSIEDATDRLGKMSAAAETYAATQGILTQGQSRQAALRAGEQGVSKSAQGKLGGMAAALGQRAVVLGESDNLGEATIEALKGLQDEFSRGELGDSFKSLGVSVSQYERSVRMAAAQKGVLPEALDRQTRQQILLAQATNDATGALALYSSEQLKGAQKTENFLQEIKAGFGRVVAGDSMGKAFGFDEADLASTEAERTRRAYEKAREKSEWTRGTVGGVGGASEGTAASLERATAEAKIAHEQAVQKTLLAESFVLQRGINQELALKTESLLMAGAAGSQELLTLNESFRLEKQRRDIRDEIAKLEAQGLEIPTALDIKLLDINQKLDANLTKSKLISKEDFWQLQKKLTGADLQNIINEGMATQLSAQVKVTDNEAKALKHRLENSKIVSSATKLEQARALAATEFRAEILKELELQGKTLEQAEAYLGHAKIQNMLKLEGEKAVNVELMKRDKLMTSEQKQILETRNLVTDLKLETLGLTTNAAAYHATIGQAVAVKAFEKWGGGAKALAERFGIGDEVLGRMVQKAGNLAGIVDLIAGGSIFTDGFLEKLFAPTKDKKDPTGAGKNDKTGSGKSKDDDMLERLRRERIERQIEDAARVRDGVERSYSHQFDFIDNNLKNVSKIWKDTYGEDGYIDQETVAGLASIEWAHLDLVKQAGDNAEKIKAINGALADKVAELHEAAYDRMMRYAFDSMYALQDMAASGAQLAGAKVLQGVEYIAEKLRENEAMARAAQTENFEAMQRVSGPGLGMIASFADKDKDGDRAATKEEKAKQRELADLQKSYNSALELHAFTEEQKAQITAKFIRERYDLERELDNLRYAENSRLRKQETDDYRAMLADSQELMSSFSDEARSTAEGSKATFQGGLSTAGKDLTTLMDAGMASGIGLLDIMDEVDLMQKNMRDAEKTGIGSVAKGFAGMIGAAGAAADGVIKNEKIKAGIKGAVHTAESIGSYAEGNLLGGTMHALAAVKFFAIAASAGSAGSTGEAKKAEATKRTALSNNTVMLSRDRGPSVLTQVFIELQPITGSSIVRTMNRDAATTRGQAIDSRWTRPTASVRTDL